LVITEKSITFAYVKTKQFKIMSEREKMDCLLLSQCEPEDIVKYFKSEDLLEAMDDEDIASYVEDNEDILQKVDDDTLIEGVTFESSLIDSIGTDDMKECLESKGYKVIEEYGFSEEEDILKKIENICKELKPRGYIDKNEAKELISDFIDFWMVRSF
jgi:hypothetical protein